MSENSEDNEQIRCKVILVGDSGVGKTSIIARYMNRYNPNEQNTIGASFTNKLENIDQKKILFEIWDTAGQERFRSINNIFYQDSYICIMVYDITQRKTFDNLDTYWYHSVKDEATEDIIFHVAGNKIDLFEDEEVDKETVQKYCDSIKAEFSLISAHQNTSVDDMFKKLGKKFLESNLYKKIEANKLPKKENRKLSINYNFNDGKSNKKKKKKRNCC